VVAAPGLTVIDTPIFIIDLRYRRDRNFSTNRAFLNRIAEGPPGATTIFNLLEVCGILSFNLAKQQLAELFHYFPRHYGVEVLPHSTLESALPTFRTSDLLEKISTKASFGDALIASAVEKHVPGAARFVSWNARHFKDRLSIPVLSPREFLQTV
jgi:hypothetical protein